MTNRRTFLLTALCLGAALVSGCYAPQAKQEEPTPLSRLAAGVAARLEIARDVAWSKANSGAPVLDAERERALLAALVKQGEAAGLEASRVEKFFAAQMAASREAQTELIAAWTAGTAKRPETKPLDLRTQIRPRLDALSAELITTLGLLREENAALDRVVLGRMLRQKGFSEAVAKLAAGGL